MKARSPGRPQIGFEMRSRVPVLFARTSTSVIGASIAFHGVRWRGYVVWRSRLAVLGAARRLALESVLKGEGSRVFTVTDSARRSALTEIGRISAWLRP
jgi:hypothetical protein